MHVAAAEELTKPFGEFEATFEALEKIPNYQTRS